MEENIAVQRMGYTLMTLSSNLSETRILPSKDTTYVHLTTQSQSQSHLLGQGTKLDSSEVSTHKENCHWRLVLNRPPVWAQDKAEVYQMNVDSQRSGKQLL